MTIQLHAAGKNLTHLDLEWSCLLVVNIVCVLRPAQSYFCVISKAYQKINKLLLKETFAWFTLVMYPFLQRNTTNRDIILRTLFIVNVSRHFDGGMSFSKITLISVSSQTVLSGNIDVISVPNVNMSFTL